MLRDVATDQQTNGSMLSLTIDRDEAARFGIQPAVIDNTLTMRSDSARRLSSSLSSTRIT